MNYNPPAFDSLKNSISDLKQHYKGNNINRTEFIKLAQHLSQLMDNSELKNELIGLLIFGLESIASEYKYTSCEPKQFYLFRTGSALDDILRKALGVSSTNLLKDSQRLIYLSSFLTYIKTKNLDEELTSYSYKNTASLIQKIEYTLKILLDREKNDIDILVKKRPSATSLKNNFLALPDKYQEKKKFYANRENSINFIKTISQECETDNLDAAQIPLTHKRLPLGYTVRLGAILYIMSQIESEYTFSSELYTLCQEAANVNHTSEITALEKRIYFAALQSFIALFDESQTWLSDIKKNLRTQLNELDDQITLDSDPHPYIATLSHTVENATKYGVNIFVGNSASVVTESPMNQYMMSATAGVIGYALFGPEGALISNRVGVLLEKTLLPHAVNNAVGKMLSQLSNVIGKTTGQAVYITFSIPTDVINSLAGFTSSLSKQTTPEIQPYDDEEWIKTLMNLPDTLFPPDKKARVRNIIEIDETKKSKNQEAVSSKTFSIS